MYMIGHPVYSGANRPAQHATYAAALADLLRRGSPMDRAHRALASARAGSHACTSRYSRGFAVESIEVIFK
jgi:hypothetical protein